MTDDARTVWMDVYDGEVFVECPAEVCSPFSVWTSPDGSDEYLREWLEEIVTHLHAAHGWSDDCVITFKRRRVRGPLERLVAARARSTARLTLDEYVRQSPRSNDPQVIEKRKAFERWHRETGSGGAANDGS